MCLFCPRYLTCSCSGDNSDESTETQQLREAERVVRKRLSQKLQDCIPPVVRRLHPGLSYQVHFCCGVIFRYICPQRFMRLADDPGFLYNTVKMCERCCVEHNERYSGFSYHPHCHSTLAEIGAQDKLLAAEEARIHLQRKSTYRAHHIQLHPLFYFVVLFFFP